MCSIMGFTSEKLTAKIVCPFFDRTLSRGPDRSRMEKAGSGYLCFHRLSIMGLTDEGMQPFHLGEDMGSLQRRALRLPCLEKEALPPVLLPQRFRL